MLLTCRPCFPPHKCRSPHPPMSPDGCSKCGRLGFQICEKRQNKSNQGNKAIQRGLGQLAVVGYLPLGRSKSSFLQRTVGTGSPWTTQWNFTLSSANTTTLLGRFTKVGRSGNQDHSKYNSQYICNYYLFIVEGTVTDSIGIRTVSTTIVIHCNSE